MDIRNNLDGLQSILDPSSTTTQKVRSSTSSKTSDEQPAKCDHASLSYAGTEALNSAHGLDVRSDKVAAIQNAIANGTYHVPASAVAGKMVDAMLGIHLSSEE